LLVVDRIYEVMRCRTECVELYEVVSVAEDEVMLVWDAAIEEGIDIEVTFEVEA